LVVPDATLDAAARDERQDRPTADPVRTDVSLPLAVNYSPQAADLVRSRRIEVDRFKCPGWPDTICAARRTLPVYIHLPLTVGGGAGRVFDAETQAPADLDAVERLLDETKSPVVNLHIVSPSDRVRGPRIGGRDSASWDAVVRQLVADAGNAVERFGSERVALENDFESAIGGPDPALCPETISRVLEETDAGLVLDLAHARLAARRMGVDVRQYVEALPVKRLREMHVSGVQPLAGRWADRLRQRGIADAAIRDYLRTSVDGMSDHLPMTADDWALTRWAVSRMQAGAWSRPWIVAFEYGGVGRWFAPVTDAETLACQIPRLRGMLRAD
jgi:uncharacterized protein (UPF0276 family)